MKMRPFSFGRAAVASWVFLAYFICASVSSAEAPRRYDGYSEVRTVVRTQAQLQAIERMGIQVNNCHIGLGPLDMVVTKKQIDDLKQLGLSVQVRIEDVQAVEELRRVQNEGRVAALSTGDPFSDFFLDYRPYTGTNSIVWYMNELVLRYPNLASMVNIGTTLQGRTIWGLRVTNSATSNKPGVVYFGGEHAREWITTTVPTYFARHLLSQYGLDSAVTNLVNNVEFYLIPVFNVDGYEYSRSTDRYWRKNRRSNGNGTFGVDLNRNWSVGWGGAGSSGVSNTETYRGSAPFSEPETQVLRDFFLSRPNIRAQLDIHSYSQLVLWPFGYTSTHSPDQSVYSEIGNTMRNLISSVFGTPFTAGPVYSTIYPASGISVDWTYAERNILSYTFELRDTGFFGFTLPADQIVPSNQELTGALLHLANSDWVRSPIRLEFPNGVPDRLTTGQPTVIPVVTVSQFETPVAGTFRIHYRANGTGPFQSSPLTHIGGSQYEAVLPAMNCLGTPNFYFTLQGSSGTQIAHPTGAPSQGVHSATVVSSTTAFFDQPLGINPGWSVQGQWAWGIPTGSGGTQGGSPDPTSGFTGTHVYGYNLSGDYANGMTEQHLTSPPIDCTGRSRVRLSFMRWLGVEDPTWDRATVRVSNDGVNWVTVWQNTSAVTDSAWTYQEFDISSVADNRPAVYLRWSMGPTDSVIAYCGWNIDDIRLKSDECRSTAGDVNGDGVVGPGDFAAFTPCFSGSGGAFGPGCDVFDFDLDGDVDCADWSDFHAAWNDSSSPPVFGACAQFAAPLVAVEGSRYLAVTPPSGGLPVALHITSPDQPCLAMYVDFDSKPDLAAAKIARLVPAPIFRTPSAWGTIHVADQRVAPERTYRFRTEYGGDDVSIYSAARTLVWGDVTDPLGVVNFGDIAGVVDRFRGLPQANSIARCDLRPANPDFVVDFADVTMALDAFKATPYPFAAQSNCP